MEALLKQLLEVIFKYLDPREIGLLVLCLCAVYIWYQHHRNKLLKEQIDFEKRKGDDFIKRAQELTKETEKTRVPHPKSEASDSVHELKLGLDAVKKLTNLLIVDDETGMRHYLALVMRHAHSDIEIDEAVDGEEALKKISSKLPSLMMLDIYMPRKTGLEVLDELKRKKINIPIIVITAYASPDFMESRGFKIGKDIFFLNKPFKLEELYRAVSEILQKQHADSNQSTNHDSE